MQRQRRLSFSLSSTSASPSPPPAPVSSRVGGIPARPPSPSRVSTPPPTTNARNRVTSSFLVPPNPLPPLRRSSSRGLLSPLVTSPSSLSPSPASAVSSAPPATPSRPIPISPPSAHPSRAHSTPNSLPRTTATTGPGGAGRRTHAAPLEPYSHRSGRRRDEAEGGDDDEESGESYDVPITDTRLLPPLCSAGVPISAAVMRGGGARALGAGGRRLSSLATYTGLPGPPHGHGAGGGAGREELRYSLASFRFQVGAQAQGTGRRNSIAGGGSTSGAGGIVRPPSPAPEAFARGAVGPLTSSLSLGAGEGGEVKRGRRESVVLGQGSLAALARGGRTGARRDAPSPARPAPRTQHAQPAASASASGLVRSASMHRQSSAARSPSPARRHSPRVVVGFNPPQVSSAAGPRAPSPARLGGVGGAGGGSAASSPAHAASTLTARRLSTSSSLPSTTTTSSTSALDAHTSLTSALIRPRSRLALPNSEQHLEVAASRDIAALDAYYNSSSRSRRGEGTREGRKEAEERLRVGYDRLARGA